MKEPEKGGYLPHVLAAAREAAEKEAAQEKRDEKAPFEQLYRAPGMDRFFESL